MTKSLLTILIPARNENGTITKTLENISSTVTIPHKICIIDDHVSPNDQTMKSVAAYAKKHPGISILRKHTGDADGYASALLRGIKAVRTSFFLFVMADSCDRLEDVNIMFTKAQQGFDVVCASRYISSGKRVGGPVIQKFLSSSYNKILFMLFKFPVHDATNAFKLFRTDSLRNYERGALYHFAFPLYLTFIAYKQGKRITEIPTVWRGRTSGNSKFRFLENALPYLRVLQSLMTR